MKTNHEETNPCRTLAPLLRYVTTRNLAVALFVAVAFLGTTRGNETEQTALAKAQQQELLQALRVGHSVIAEFSDGGLLY